jgi:hypothetical protein
MVTLEVLRRSAQHEVEQVSDADPGAAERQTDGNHEHIRQNNEDGASEVLASGRGISSRAHGLSNDGGQFVLNHGGGLEDRRRRR